MIDLSINGLPVSVERGTTLLEAIRFLGFEVPTLCHREDLTPYGACRLCVVEIGEGETSKLVSSCTYPCQAGLKVRTRSQRVVATRKVIIELLLASCPSSKVIQDLASQHGVRRVRFRPEHDDCILCGLCVRVCREQMMAGAIGFTYRGSKRRITTPFEKTSEECRRCGACMYVCPVCSARCTINGDHAICGACANLEPPCLEIADDALCYLDPCAACELPRTTANPTTRLTVTKE